MLGEEIKVFVPITIDSTETEYLSVSSTSGHDKYLPESETSSSVIFNITAVTDGEIFFFAPSDYKRETDLYVNNSKKGKFFDNKTDRIISLGVFEAGKTVRVELKLTQDDLYLKKDNEFFYYIDTEVFNEAFERLKSNPQYKIDEGFKQSHLTGSISTTEASQTIFTSIPYDKGWHITVDGVEVETYEVANALIAFDIPEAGEHTLQMRYFPTAYKIGLTLSIIGIIAFIAIIIIEKISKTLFRRFMKLEGADAEEELWLLEDFDEDAEREKLLSPEERKAKTIK